MKTKPKPKHPVYISWDLFSRFMTLRGRLATHENKLKVKDLIEDALTKYLDEAEKQ